MFKINEFKELMGSQRNVVITTHHNPDADALGSSLALAKYLEKKGHQVKVIVPSEFPDFLNWMPGTDRVLIYSPHIEVECKQLIDDADLVFCLDFSTYNRLKTLENIIRDTSSKIFVIDHHLAPEIEGNFRIWSVEASSTAELVYDFIEMMGDKDLIDPAIGECIYAGIVTDTSSFKHPSTTKRVHLIAAELMDLGVQTNQVQRSIYDNNSESRMRFLGYALKDKLKILREYRTAYFIFTMKELEMYHNKLGDTEGLVNYALSINDIVLAAIIIEKSDCVKMSFRSAGDFSVNELAREHFSGGGHKNAAGGNSKLSMEETEKKFLDLLPYYKEQLLRVD